MGFGNTKLVVIVGATLVVAQMGGHKASPYNSYSVLTV